MNVLAAAAIGALLATAQLPSFHGSQQSALQRSVPVVQNSAGSASAYWVGSGALMRTAGHVARYGPNLVDGRIADVVCLDSDTDSALLRGATGPGLQEDHSSVALGDRVIVAGWPRGKYSEFHGTVHGYILSTRVDRVDVGPLMFVKVGLVEPVPYGISGGPVVRDGKVVATTIGFSDTIFAAVPVSASACKVNAGQ